LAHIERFYFDMSMQRDERLKVAMMDAMTDSQLMAIVGDTQVKSKLSEQFWDTIRLHYSPTVEDFSAILTFLNKGRKRSRMTPYNVYVDPRTGAPLPIEWKFTVLKHRLPVTEFGMKMGDDVRVVEKEFVIEVVNNDAELGFIVMAEVESVVTNYDRPNCEEVSYVRRDISAYDDEAPKKVIGSGYNQMEDPFHTTSGWQAILAQHYRGEGLIFRKMALELNMDIHDVIASVRTLVNFNGMIKESSTLYGLPEWAQMLMCGTPYHEGLKVGKWYVPWTRVKVGMAMMGFKFDRCLSPAMFVNEYFIDYPEWHLIFAGSCKHSNFYATEAVTPQEVMKSPMLIMCTQSDPAMVRFVKVLSSIGAASVGEGPDWLSKRIWSLLPMDRFVTYPGTVGPALRSIDFVRLITQLDPPRPPMYLRWDEGVRLARFVIPQSVVTVRGSGPLNLGYGMRGTLLFGAALGPREKKPLQVTDLNWNIAFQGQYFAEVQVWYQELMVSIAYKLGVDYCDPILRACGLSLTDQAIPKCEWAGSTNASGKSMDTLSCDEGGVRVVDSRSRAVIYTWDVVDIIKMQTLKEEMAADFGDDEYATMLEMEEMQSTYDEGDRSREDSVEREPDEEQRDAAGNLIDMRGGRPMYPVGYNPHVVPNDFDSDDLDVWELAIDPLYTLEDYEEQDDDDREVW